MRAETDLAILGGGCAGLSLAMRLSQSPRMSLKTVVIESRPQYANDRTWCFWGGPEQPPIDGNLVRRHWPRVAVSTHRAEAIADCSVAPYQMIPASSFYKAATAAISSNPQIELAMNETARSEPRKEGHCWRIETSRGTRWAKAIIDTRPAPMRPLLWQSFYGQEIECDQHRFDPTTVRLMDFAKVTGKSISFLYLLPLARNRALVEATVFAEEPLCPAQLSETRDAFIQRAVRGARYSASRTEHGTIPMGAPAAESGQDVSFVRAGLGAGAARPSSGFAFQRIQSWALDCARALVAGKPPVTHPRDPWIQGAMDRLFLQVIRAQPQKAPELFLALFAMKDPGPMLRFMSDRASWADCAAIIRALPPWPFVRELARSLVPRRRDAMGAENE